ncbi:MAG: hypothetical protein D6722_27300 [Bacteroidetes bacterium]|nr:MAG: hypothetical protein D6722_27300 [Bacteroidota bacterium]
MTFYGCSSDKPEKPTTPPVVEQPAVTDTTPADTVAAEPEPEPEPAPTPAPTGGGLRPHAVQDGSLATLLETVARNMEAQKLAYVSSLGQDCSGIYHKLKDSVKLHIPAFRDPARFTFPEYASVRSSRHIAYWYHEHDNLYIVRDGKAAMNMVKPGCVMFFGRTDEQYNNITIDLLTNPNGNFVHDGINGKIMHIAVVTSVEKDENGNVVEYTMMHGRNTRYPASRSSGNCDCPSKGLDKQFGKFPFGNWNQQWVAMANIETPVE